MMLPVAILFALVLSPLLAPNDGGRNAIALLKSLDVDAYPCNGTQNNISAAIASAVAFSPTNAWSVGYYNGVTIAEHWNGLSWTLVPTPNIAGLSNYLQSVSAIPETKQLWAAGGTTASLYSGAPLIERWTGQSWQMQNIPNLPAYLYSISAGSKTHAWAVGENTIGNKTKPLALKWDGHAWTVAPVPLPQHDEYAVLSSVIDSVDGTALAVGWSNNQTGETHTLVERYANGAWSVIPMPLQNGFAGAFESMTPIPGTHNVWAAGEYQDRPMVALGDGNGWRQMAVPLPPEWEGGSLYAIAANGPSDAIAVGDYSTYYNQYESFAERWDGSQWTLLAPYGQSRFIALGAAEIPGSKKAWLTGYSDRNAHAMNQRCQD